MFPCDHCISGNSEVEICLAEGQLYYVCGGCVEPCIKENASTENPVHSIERV